MDTVLRQSYIDLFANCATLPAHESDVAHFIRLATRPLSVQSYKTVETVCAVPWYVVALIHGMEGDFDFSTHLHNGDPLSARTVHVPKGRPPLPLEPPFKWVDSAVDSLRLDKFTGWLDWSIAGICYKLESYNGWGYRAHKINSPYLWSFSNNYERGKYTSDGHWDADAVSQQVGAITALKEMVDQKLVDLLAEPVTTP